MSMDASQDGRNTVAYLRRHRLRRSTSKLGRMQLYATVFILLVESGKLNEDSLATMLLRKADWHDCEGIMNSSRSWDGQIPQANKDVSHLRLAPTANHLVTGLL